MKAAPQSSPCHAELPLTPTRYRSKTAVVWLAILAGSFGLHRFYLRGLRDPVGWLLPLPTLAGLLGLRRLELLGQDDRLAWWLAPWLGLSLSAAMLAAIIYALTPDERWDSERNPGHPPRTTRWGPVLGAVLALALGATALISAIAFTFQKVFESAL